jgi:dihydropteroate synthase
MNAASYSNPHPDPLPQREREKTIDTRHGPLVFGGRCLVMGILNVTPDSFSDGGLFGEPVAAIAHGRRMVADGADCLDVGGESTRPGSEGVEAAVQIERVVPVIRGLRDEGVDSPISIDTRSAAVAAAALDAGADIVNDVSGARHDPEMAELLAREGAAFILMHMQGTPATMQIAPQYDDVVAEVGAFLDERAAALAAAGVDTSKMIVDPGIGFGKTTEHNLTLLREIGRFVGRWPVLVGASRKRFLRQVMEKSPKIEESIVDARASRGTGDLLAGDLAVAMHCALAGVGMVRVHDVGPIRRLVESVG